MAEELPGPAGLWRLCFQNVNGVKGETFRVFLTLANLLKEDIGKFWNSQPSHMNRVASREEGKVPAAKVADRSLRHPSFSPAPVLRSGRDVWSGRKVEDTGQ